MMNKKGFTTSSFLIGLIVFSALFALLALMAGDLGTQYGNPGIIDEDIEENYNKLDESTNRVSESLRAVSDSGGLSLVGTFDVFFSAAFSIIQIVLGSLPIMSSIVSNFFLDFGIDERVAGIIFPTFLAIITIIIVFVIINSTTRKDI